MSILIFFSISFTTILLQINPLHYYEENEMYKLDIGFPFTYYYQFLLSGSNSPNCGWILDKLIIDCLLTWIVVVGFYLLITHIKKKF